MPEPGFDTAQAHRWFAIEFNNAAWDLIEAASLTCEELDRLRQLASASYLHWQAVGTPLHHLRALALLAFAHAVLGEGAQAVRHAATAKRREEDGPEGMTPFDRTLLSAGMSAAHRSAGNRGQAAVWKSRAQAQSCHLDPEETQLIDRLLAVIPARARTA